MELAIPNFQTIGDEFLLEVDPQYTRALYGRRLAEKLFHWLDPGEIQLICDGVAHGIEKTHSTPEEKIVQMIDTGFAFVVTLESRTLASLFFARYKDVIIEKTAKNGVLTDQIIPSTTWPRRAPVVITEEERQRRKDLLFSKFNYYLDHPDEIPQAFTEGWSDLDGDGVLDKMEGDQKKRLRLRIYVYEEQDNTVRVQVANLIRGMLEDVGFEAPVVTESFSDIKERLSKRNFDMCIAAFQMDVIPDPGFLLMSNNTGNYTGYKSKEMDKLFKDLRAATDFVTYQSLLHQIQDLFAQDCPFICLYYRSGALLTRKIFTVARDVREPEILRGIESIGK
jgi:hypothetical protein